MAIVKKMGYRKQEWRQEAGRGCSWSSPRRDERSLYRGCSDGGEKGADSGHITQVEPKDLMMGWKLGGKEREGSEQLSSWAGGVAFCKD